MPLQNRVTPFGNIISHPSREGTLMGNRGILHDDRRTLGKARWKHMNWITCLLSFKGRHRTPMTPNRYTELFFLDEAVALSAGHRPCAECRRDRYNAFMDAWRIGCANIGPATAKAVDRALHGSRVDSATRRQTTYPSLVGDLPDGVFVNIDGRGHLAHLVWGEALIPYSPNGYGVPIPRPNERKVTVLTPAPIVRVLAAGYRPEVHSSARTALGTFANPPGAGRAAEMHPASSRA